jgi:hypothetical protein
MRYAIVRLEPLAIVRGWNALPPSLDLPNGKRVVSPVLEEHVGGELDGYRFVTVVEVGFDQQGPYYTPGGDTLSLDGGMLTVTRSWTAWTQEEIDAADQARRDAIAAQLSDVDDLTRAALLVMLDEFNRHSAVHRAILAAAAAATSLADFKARMGQITGIPERTPQQLLDAAIGKLGS